MGKIKFFVGVGLFLAVSVFCSSSKSMARSMDNSDVPAKAIIDFKTGDEKAVISPKYNCDPKMLIPGNPYIDPKFLLDLLPKK